MFKQYLYILAAFFAVTATATAQQDSIVLSGTLSVQRGATYRYKLVAGQVKDKWLGYSLLDEGGVNETRSTVMMNFIKDKSSMIFTEKELLGSRAKSSDFCFVGGVLKLEGKKDRLKGVFFGHDQNKKICGTGIVTFQVQEAVKKLLTPDGQRDTTLSTIITRLKDEHFTVNNATVQLQLWDGGVQDHDSLVIILNDQTVQERFEIAAERKTVTLQLKKGKNVLRIRALNEGNEPPNSARIAVIDGGKKYALVSFLKKGEEAKVIIAY
jgi:hypothetical protein